MAQSHCIKCGSYKFEIADSHLKHKETKLVFVQCSSCGGVVGVFEMRDAEKFLENQAEDRFATPDMPEFEL